MVAVAIITTTAATVYAQDPDPEPPPCTPNDGYNCTALQWQGPQNKQMQVSVCGVPCNINVVFWTRKGTCGSLPPIQEFQITQIELNDPGCPYNCLPKPTTADDYLAQATFQMLYFNFANLDLTPGINGGCRTDIRASMSSCQFIWQSRFGRRYVIKCANAPECCSAGYRVCNDGQGHITSVKTITQPTPPNQCPPDDVTGGQTPCKPSCNALYDLIDPYYGKTIRTGTSDDDNGATVAPNPATTATTITSPAMVDGGALLMLYDARGAAVDHQRAGHTSSGRYSFALDVSKFPAGMYYYSIKADNDKAMSVGHLTVTR